MPRSMDSSRRLSGRRHGEPLRNKPIPIAALADGNCLTTPQEVRHPLSVASGTERLSQITDEYRACKSKVAYFYMLAARLSVSPMAAKGLIALWPLVRDDKPELQRAFSDLIVGAADGIAKRQPINVTDRERSQRIAERILTIATSMGEPCRGQVVRMFAASVVSEIADSVRQLP
jgi:hypothetical protein